MVTSRDNMRLQLWNVCIFRWVTAEKTFAKCICSSTPWKNSLENTQPTHAVNRTCKKLINVTLCYYVKVNILSDSEILSAKIHISASLQFNKVMSLSGDNQTAVGTKAHGSQLIKQT